MSMKKILTIDFDIIMYPCISLYNDLVGGDANPTQLWEFLKQARSLEPFLHYDATVLNAIGKIIAKQRANKVPFYSYQEHQEVTDHLKATTTYDDDIYQVTNIDFHHDIWYRPEDKNTLLNFDNYNCSNWLGYLLLHNKINTIDWFKASNSSFFQDNEYNQELPLTTHRLDELSLLDQETFDEVYFILSPQWVPYEFHHLFDLIINLTQGE